MRLWPFITLVCFRRKLSSNSLFFVFFSWIFIVFYYFYFSPLYLMYLPHILFISLISLSIHLPILFSLYPYPYILVYVVKHTYIPPHLYSGVPYDRPIHAYLHIYTYTTRIPAHTHAYPHIHTHTHTYTRTCMFIVHTQTHYRVTILIM